jgi:hypothetical protein
VVLVGSRSVIMTNHESRLDDPKGIRTNGAHSSSSHGREDMKRPGMLAGEWLVAFDLRSRIETLLVFGVVHSCWGFAKGCFDAVIDCEVNSPGGEIAQDGGPKAAIETSETVLGQDALHQAYSYRKTRRIRDERSLC